MVDKARDKDIRKILTWEAREIPGTERITIEKAEGQCGPTDSGWVPSESLSHNNKSLPSRAHPVEYNQTVYYTKVNQNLQISRLIFENFSMIHTHLPYGER